ncbi:MAG TPA: hypothetical protein ACFYD7_12685 [Candidatus Wujingus californicus]|uniref:hypothetical protein n=1 Tax=Candidatus Wujingus californicus TaxID=3367618 RepID=UPI004028F128
MKKIFLAAVVFIMFLLLNKYAQAQTVDVTGTWEGYYEVPDWDYSAELTVELEQTGNEVTGNATTSDECKGKVTGTVNGYIITFKVKVKQTTVCCKGKWKGTAVVNENQDYMAMSFTIKDDCNGYAAGSGELWKVSQ